MECPQSHESLGSKGRLLGAQLSARANSGRSGECQTPRDKRYGATEVDASSLQAKVWFGTTEKEHPCKKKHPVTLLSPVMITAVAMTASIYCALHVRRV